MLLWSFEGAPDRARAFTISAVLPAGKHLFPFRTEKLSLPGPMVLGGQPPGRVGRRRFTFAKPAFGRLRSFRPKYRRPRGVQLTRPVPPLDHRSERRRRSCATERSP